jgi:hypothetical protein
MAIELTNEEKLNIVNQHIKSVDYNIYGLQLDLLEAQAVDAPDQTQISSLNSRISSANARRVVLVTERNSLTPQSEE